jgi:hypothetical protein
MRIQTPNPDSSIGFSNARAFCKKEANRNDFFGQLESISRNISLAGKSLNQTLDQEQQNKSALEGRLQQMNEMHREYYELLKQLRKEIKINEKLGIQLSSSDS